MECRMNCTCNYLISIGMIYNCIKILTSIKTSIHASENILLSCMKYEYLQRSNKYKKEIKFILHKNRLIQTITIL